MAAKDKAEVNDYARLFLLPGVLHCAGGPGPDKVDWLTAISEWVEKDKAPERLLASKTDGNGKTILTRPLCPYPQVAVCDGKGEHAARPRASRAARGSCMSRPRSILREPLVHFLIGGALLFALDAWSGRDDDDPSYQVAVGAGQIDRLQQAWQAQSGRAPNHAGAERAGRGPGARGDLLSRGRSPRPRRRRRAGAAALAQKLSFLIEDLAAVEQPGDDELRRFYQQRARSHTRSRRA